MRKLIITVVVFAAATGLYAQNTFFPTKAGMELLYVNNDDKGRPSSHTKTKIKEVTGSGQNMSITYGSEVLDKNRNPPKNSLGEQIYKVTVKDGVVIMDLKQSLAPELQQEGMNIEITGAPMELPGNLQPGQKLKDSDVTMTVDLVIFKTTTVIKMTDQECLAIEDVTTPAGTFKCHKITQTVTTTVGNKNTTGKTISWYAFNIGTVKTETYDAKNKLTGGTALLEVKGN
jgi:hypothetical protein